MPDATLVATSIAAGALSGAGVFVAFGGARHRVDAISRARRSAPPEIERALHVGDLRARLAMDLERAGWRESPERVTVFSIALSACMAVLGASTISFVPIGTAAVICAVGIVSGLGLPLLALRSAIARRRRRIEGELAPLLELFTLELGGGGSAMSALGSVAMQVQGDLATDLRRLLIASQLTGSASFESRLVEYSERLESPAIGSLATILASGREYGTGVVQSVRTLAADLRRAQRRELIAHSRRTLNHVLLPAAVGVLLPFLAVLMFPAVTALQRTLR
jgi:Flp pilus assembly protein TadB